MRTRLLKSNVGARVGARRSRRKFSQQAHSLRRRLCAGGGNDIFARLVGDKVREFLGQPVVIENKPGGGGRLAGEYVMGQPADGYTVLVGAAGMVALVPVIYPKTGYHPTRTYYVGFDDRLVPADPCRSGIHRARSLAELIAWAKAHPDKANYATSSPAFTITTELLKLKTGMPGVPIPYKSTNEMMVSVASEQTLFAIGDGPPTVPLVQAGKIRPLAVTGAERSLELPDVPTMAALGQPQVIFLLLYFVFLWIAWLLAVKMTEPKDSKQVAG